MSAEAVSAIDADLARVNAASLQLSAALANEQTSADAKPNDIEREHAAVQAAEAYLTQVEAAVHADQAASATATGGHSVTDPGGIVV